MKSRNPLLLTLMIVAAALLVALGQEIRGNDSRPVTTAKSAPDRPAVKKAGVVKPIEGDRAYKAHCSRCHVEPRKFSERKTATIMRHMRVRANLTEEEAEAILRYLRQ